MLKKIGAAVVILALVAGGCAKKADVAGSEAALRAADEAWAKTGSNADAFAGYFATDGVIMPPNQPAVSGPESIRSWASQLTALPGFALTWTPTEVVVARSGEMGYTVGSFRMSMQGANGIMSDTGKYLTVWKKDATGEWKVSYDMFSSDTPLAPPASAEAPATESK